MSFRFLLCALAVVCTVGLSFVGASAQPSYDRADIPGHYTIGLYADAKGSSQKLTLDKEQSDFELFVGVTGDSTLIFSGVTFRLELPKDVRLAGPIRWNSIAGLVEKDRLLDNGVQVEFNRDCQIQKGPGPLMLGRIPLSADPTFRSATIEPLAHRKYKLSVELCQDARGWPKPYADPVATVVTRKQTLWEKLTSWMR